MSGATPPLPNAFMAWCSVKKKHRNSLTFALQSGYGFLNHVFLTFFALQL